jgi:transposase
LGRPVFLRIRPKRLRCTSCDGQPTTTQQLDWYDPNGLHTKAFEQQLIVGLVNSTITDLVAKEDVSCDALLGILDRWVAKMVDWDALDPFSTLGIDEIALTRGHRNLVAVISARTDSGHLQLLAVLPDRLKTTLVAWLTSIPVAVREHITTVCTDMWEGYVTAVQEVAVAVVAGGFVVWHVQNIEPMFYGRATMKQPDWHHRPHYLDYVFILLIVGLLLLGLLFLKYPSSHGTIFPNISNSIDPTP